MSAGTSSSPAIALIAANDFGARLTCEIRPATMMFHMTMMVDTATYSTARMW